LRVEERGQGRRSTSNTDLSIAIRLYSARGGSCVVVRDQSDHPDPIGDQKGICTLDHGLERTVVNEDCPQEGTLGSFSSVRKPLKERHTT